MVGQVKYKKGQLYVTARIAYPDETNMIEFSVLDDKEAHRRLARKEKKLKELGA